MSSETGAPLIADRLPPSPGATVDVVVEASFDAGGFYCEHCFYAASVAAGPGVAVGFLHVPPDTHGPRIPQATRHHATRAVVAAALRGLLAGLPGDVDIVLTGFEAWGEVTRNPSGDFVGHVTNIDAVLRALGSEARPRRRRRLASALAALAGRSATIDGRRVTLWPVVLPVDDGAIDGGPRSVQRAMAACHPRVVLSLGVHRRTDRYRVEHLASDRQLRLIGDGGFAHDVGVVASHTFASNEALARAIVSGWRWGTSCPS